MLRLTEADRTTLAELAETFVRGDALRRAALATEHLESTSDPDQLRQLRVALRLMESRVANLVLAGRPTPFRALSPLDRERYLLGWAHSRFATRRTAFAALRGLLTFLAYADPGPTGSNHRWPGLGYRPDQPPPARRRNRIRAADLPAAPAGFETTIDADVAVVGSGAAGGVVAHELTKAGRSVVVLEAGSLVDEPTMPTDELGGYRSLYLDGGPSPTSDGSVTTFAGGAVGGGTVVTWMTCVPAPEALRSEWARFHGVDGVDGAEWDGDSAAIEAELRATPVAPIPPKDEAVLRGAVELGWRAGVVRRNAEKCATCGSCGFGCRAGTKQSGLRVHLADAVAGGTRLIPEVRVERAIVVDGRVGGVEAELPGGRRLTVRANQVVVAAGALRTPIVLARSGILHASIGRHLRLQPRVSVLARMPEAIETWRGPLLAAAVEEFVDGDDGRNGYLIESAPFHPGLLAMALPWEGADRHAALIQPARQYAPLVAVGRDGGEGRVHLTRAGFPRLEYELDAIGDATLRHALVSLARLGRAAGARELIVPSARPLRHGARAFAPGTEDRHFVVFEDRLRSIDLRPTRTPLLSTDQLGTVRMGADPANYPCDPRGRVRADSVGARVLGLYVADGSLLPTALGVGPMVTIMALARRVSRTVLAEGGSGRR